MWGINALGSVVVEIETDNGEVGVGQLLGGPPTGSVVP